MPLQKLVFKPGVSRETTNYADKGSWWDADKVRFKAGFPEKIGGWVLYSQPLEEFWGSCNVILPFQYVSGEEITAFGTNLKAYIEKGALFYDITPIRDTQTLASNAFTTVSGSPVVEVNAALHNCVTGDFVIISDVPGDINGIPASALNAEHRVTVIDANNFTVTVGANATSTGTTGACEIAYLISTGLPYYAPVVGGWGAGPWSSEAWGGGDEVGTVYEFRTWSLANYGIDLILGPNGGDLYYWGYDNGAGLFARAERIADMPGALDVPTSQSFVFVTNERFVVTLGSNDVGGTDPVPMLVRWSDQENYLDWEPRATNQAGSQVQSVGSFLVTALNTRQETLIWSDAALLSMQYQGPPYVYGFNLIHQGCTIISRRAAITVNNVVFWMGIDKFYVYDGAVKVLPCSVREYIYDRLNLDQARQTFVGTVEEYNEIWWFYCSQNSLYTDSYVIYNYAEGTWSIGTLDRTSWVDSTLKSTPIGTTYDVSTEKGRMYAHESGNDDGTVTPAAPINAYIDSADFDAGEGDNFVFIDKIIPDMSFEGSTSSSPSVTMTLSPRRFPGSAYGTPDAPAVVGSATFPVEEFTEQVFVRVRGRQVRLRVGSNTTGVAWQLGAPRIQLRLDGKR
jgi:hypothetical protein